MTTPPTLSAPKVLLMGPPGSGKTHSLSTLLAAGIEVFVLSTESNGLDTLLDVVAAKKLPLENLHWNYVAPAKIGWSTFQKLATIGNTMSFEAIANMKSGIERPATGQIMDALRLFENFHDQRTGKDYGDVTTWTPSRALVLDSLTGLNDLILQNTVGLKPNPAPGEWGIAMNFEHNLLKKLCGDTSCYFICIAHIDRGVNEATLVQSINPAAIGAKLGPKIGTNFSEVILSKRIGPSFLWSTSESTADVKNRSLPISDKLEPSFLLIVDAFLRRQKQVAPAKPAAAVAS